MATPEDVAALRLQMQQQDSIMQQMQQQMTQQSQIITLLQATPPAPQW